jgi:hypothetical protein
MSGCSFCKYGFANKEPRTKNDGSGKALYAISIKTFPGT